MTLLAINHHYYRTESTGRGIYPTTPQALRAEVEQVVAHGWKIGDQRDLLDHLEGLDRPRRLCVLTFDDGLKEQMTAIVDLAAVGACAICFVPTQPLLELQVLDVHKLQMVRARLPDEQLADMLNLRFGFHGREFDEQHLAIQYRYDAPLSRRVKYFLNFMLEPQARDSWLSQAFSDLLGDERAAASSLYMTEDDLRLLARLGLIGSHAHSHRPLATLDAATLGSELQRSFDELKRITGVAPLGISYPYGGQSAVSQAVFDAATDCGYRYGFTMKRGTTEVTEALQGQAMSLNRVDTNDVADWLAAGH
ncbi:polysaccharide deacetylase family protein [Rhizobacter sp. J219]|uniref:polysaccharide deacetylase family protein n=1 Tax=Rhizobacter sp. J219 TaxID=2898430 RepID=UPI002151B9FC|nr:polysaccharide deacetylase family protein [Rhizobacter sp. J219]MCR5885711.1 polysaccharide deacetylase family protein [Rhizobacter sp. J219]